MTLTLRFMAAVQGCFPYLVALTLLGHGGILSNALQARETTQQEERTRPRVDYGPLAFEPEVWKKKQTDTHLEVWKGKEVVFLAAPIGIDASLMEKWVARLDAGWALYRDITGASPQPYKVLDDMPLIAAVPDGSYTCGAGCGMIGATGIELALFYQSDLELLEKHPGAMPHYVFYEMGRNYFTFGKRHDAFTTGFAVFMRYVCMDTLALEDHDREVRKTIESLESHFSSSRLSFLELFSNAGNHEKSHRIQGKMPSDQPCTYASAMLRLWKEQGGNTWLKKFFEALRSCPEIDAKGEVGDLQQGWLWFLCASFAAEKDLSPIFVDEWKLPVSESNRQVLKSVRWKGENQDKVAEIFAKLTFD